MNSNVYGYNWVEDIFDRWTTSGAMIKSRSGLTINPNYNKSESYTAPMPMMNYTLFIDKVIINYPATVIIWKDKTKTVVKCKDGDDFDPEKGILLCILKKMMGGSNMKMKKWLDKQTEKYYQNIDIEECLPIFDPNVVNVVKRALDGLTIRTDKKDDAEDKDEN